jgi:hypothetical protein
MAKACQLSRREGEGVREGEVLGNEQDAKGG